MVRDITNEDLFFFEETKKPELSKQQHRIIQLMCKGKTNAEIAEHLSISHKTLKNHLSVLYKKMGVKNRTEAALLWLQFESQSDKDMRIKDLEKMIIEKDREISRLKKVIYELRR